MLNRIIFSILVIICAQAITLNVGFASEPEASHPLSGGTAEHNLSPAAFSFRKTNWGMGKDEVKKSEPLAPVREEENGIIYKTVLLGKNVLLAYAFQDNKLVRAKYILAEEHSNKNLFISDFEEFVKALTKKYGEPKSNDHYWLKDLYKNKISEWGLAISLGHLAYYAQWSTKPTKITAWLTGDNYSITCGIEYDSNELAEFDKKAMEKKADSQL